MGPSTFISAALHIAILLFVIAGFSSSNMRPAPLVAIPIDVATSSDNTKVKAGTSDAKDDAPLAAKQEAPKPQAVKEKAAKAPEQTAAIDKPAETAPKAEPKPEKKAEAPKPQPKPAAPTRKPDPPAEKAEAKTPKAPPPQPKKQEFDTDRIAALLNKIPDAKHEPQPLDLADETRPVRGQSTGSEMTMSINELDALRARISECWTPPPGGLGADDIVVRIRLKLNKDGTLEGYPTVANAGTSPFFQAAADSAVRAVYQCQPYALPVEKYALWRDMILNFDPSQMYRSG
ncbi:MAG: cell envelope integrity protein TolA [Methyloceanibacter sp.]|uniref:cell envelope integrity protein TolA n=1 Tax=Methyloceanibacter sp. TaxID=1965321 RepID=UPI003D6CE53E